MLICHKWIQLVCMLSINIAIFSWFLCFILCLFCQWLCFSSCCNLDKTQNYNMNANMLLSFWISILFKFCFLFFPLSLCSASHLVMLLVASKKYFQLLYVCKNPWIQPRGKYSNPLGATYLRYYLYPTTIFGLPRS